MRTLGFTGTRKGMTKAQKEVVDDVLHVYDELHHGSCIGADFEAHILATCIGLRIVTHPPTNEKHMAPCKGHERRSPLPYLERNKRIVEESDSLLAAPAGPEVIRGSGTWATIRYARRVSKSIIIVWPNGEITEE